MTLLLAIATLTFIFFLPSALMQAFQLDSLAIGVILSTLIPLILIIVTDIIKSKNFKIQKKILATFSTFSIFAFAHSIPPLFFVEKIEINRLIIGYIFILLLIISSKKIQEKAVNIDQNTFEMILQSQLIFFAINFAFILSGFTLFTTTSSKPAFIFSEPSHLAIAFSPVFIYFVYTKRIFGIILIALYFYVCLKIENLTMLASILLAILTRMPLKTAILISPVVFFSIINLDSLNYFYERINLTTNTENLSALVLMQGWENSLLTLKDTFFWGAGFQQFGISTQIGEISNIIFSIFGTDYNLKDGGSTAPKLIGELGLFGMALIAAYMFILFGSFRRIKKLQNTSFISKNPQCIFAASVIISYSLEMFIRGVGYFSPLSLLFYSSIWHHFLTRTKFTKKKVFYASQTGDR